MPLSDPIVHEVDAIQQQLQQFADEGKKVFASSSFQSHSLPMVHMIATFQPTIPVYFLNTGYHFAETMVFRHKIAADFGLKVIDLSSPVSKSMQKDASGKLLFASDPDRCCYLNKTLPLEEILMAHDIWITGVRRDQNANRASFNHLARGPHNTMRYHPMLNWTSKMIWEYIRYYELPQHPLEMSGYKSIGCEPCTYKYELPDDSDRDSRWAGLQKTECGLHTDLIEKP